MSTGDGIAYKSENPIQVHPSQNFELKFYGNERTLLVYWNNDAFLENAPQENSNAIICQLEGYSWDNLAFTGSEFDNVVLVAGRNIDTTSQEFLIVLYKIISRARKTLMVFSHPSNLAEFKSLLTLSDTDVKLDKQRCDNNLSSTAISALSSLKEGHIKQLDSLQSGKDLFAMSVHYAAPQALYNKAFMQFLKTDTKSLYPLMHGYSIDSASSYSTDSASSLIEEPNHDIRATLACLLSEDFEPCLKKILQFLPSNNFECLDMALKLAETNFSSEALYKNSQSLKIWTVKKFC